jgi:uncharacterized protein (DUF2252 family)
MAADLAVEPHTDLEVQMCGDAHALNFGLWATPERNLSFDLRDFDETLRGPFEWDVKRFVASLVVLAREVGLSARAADDAVAVATRSYRERMQSYADANELDIWYDLITVDQLLEVFDAPARERVATVVEKEARKRTSRGAYKKLTEIVDGHPRIIEDPPRRVRISADGEPEMVQSVLERYRMSLREDRRHLLDRFTVMDWVRQVVGVGSVGMRVYLVLSEGRSADDPLFLQLKQAGPSVYEAALKPSPLDNHGARVVAGQRMLQSATDILVGWTTVGPYDFYVRQFRDMKVIPTTDTIGPYLEEFATKCGAVLARAHAKSGDPLAIASYIGKGARFDDALATFARAYADQTERDRDSLAASRPA